MNSVKPVRINLDAEHHALLLRVRMAIVERNKERSVNGLYTSLEGTAFRDIVQRGIGMVAREVIAEPDVI